MSHEIPRLSPILTKGLEAGKVVSLRHDLGILPLISA